MCVSSHHHLARQDLGLAVETHWIGVVDLAIKSAREVANARRCAGANAARAVFIRVLAWTVAAKVPSAHALVVWVVSGEVAILPKAPTDVVAGEVDVLVRAHCGGTGLLRWSVHV